MVSKKFPYVKIQTQTNPENKMYQLVLVKNLNFDDSIDLRDTFTGSMLFVICYQKLLFEKMSECKMKTQN